MSKQKVFDQLVPLLAGAIPAAVKSLDVQQPTWCLSIRYFDTHAPSTYLELVGKSEASRTKRMEADESWELWSPGATEEDRSFAADMPGAPPRSPEEERIQSIFKLVYAFLCDTDGADMVPFRKALFQVTQKLNRLKWGDILPVTDDFVVVPGDGSAHFCDDADLTEGIPADRLRLLKSRGYL